MKLINEILGNKIKILFTAALISVLLFSAVPICAQSTFDIKGWNDARWGMTENELKNIFKDTLIKTDKRQYMDDNKLYRDLKMSNFFIDGINFNVFFEMGSDNNKLKRVRLVDLPAIPSYFNQLEHLLTMNYGTPLQKSETSQALSRDRYKKSASWLFPSTKIELSYTHSQNLSDSLMILYTDRRFAKNDKSAQKKRDGSIKELSGNYGKSKYGGAPSDSGQGTGINQKDAKSYSSHGVAYGNIGKYDKAVVDFNKAIELNPKDASAFYNRGVVYCTLEIYDEAIVDFSKAIELNPKDEKAYCNRGIANSKLGKYDEAIADINKAIELNPEDAKAYYNRACIYSIKNNRDEAINDLSTAIRMNPYFMNRARTDKDFDNIINTPKFKKLMGKRK